MYLVSLDPSCNFKPYHPVIVPPPESDSERARRDIYLNKNYDESLSVISSDEVTSEEEVVQTQEIQELENNIRERMLQSMAAARRRSDAKPRSHATMSRQSMGGKISRPNADIGLPPTGKKSRIIFREQFCSNC